MQHFEFIKQITPSLNHVNIWEEKMGIDPQLQQHLLFPTT
jgi:hypothetical protein